MGSAEWKLDPYVFQQVAKRFAPIQVDLFATRINTKLAQYISWKPDPSAMAVDALMTPWTNLQGYAFPPFCLLGRCLQKIASEEAAVVLIGTVTPLQFTLPGSIQPTTPPCAIPCSKARRLDDLRKRFTSTRVSEQATSLITAGWSRVPTLHTNLPVPDGSAGVSRYLFSICDRLRQLLGQPLQRGSSYRSVNTICSAVSVTHRHVSGSPIGQHALVTRLMKVIYNSRPPARDTPHPGMWDRLPAI